MAPSAQDPYQRQQRTYICPFCDCHKKAPTFSLLSLLHSLELPGRQEAGRAVVDSHSTPGPSACQPPWRDSLPHPKENSPWLWGRGGQGDFIFSPLPELTAWTVAPEEQTLFLGRRAGLRLKWIFMAFLPAPASALAMDQAPAPHLQMPHYWGAAARLYAGRRATRWPCCSRRTTVMAPSCCG